jgi:peptidoglycan hydrolase-like protein with peptidoglycan-binding domain
MTVPSGRAFDGPGPIEVTRGAGVISDADGEQQPLVIDGGFGPATEDRVKQEQSQHKIAADGQVSPYARPRTGDGWSISISLRTSRAGASDRPSCGHCCGGPTPTAYPSA